MFKKLLAAVVLFTAVGFATLVTPLAADAQVIRPYNGGWHGGYYGQVYRNGFSQGYYWVPNTYIGTNGRAYFGTYSYPGYYGGTPPYSGMRR